MKKKKSVEELINDALQLWGCNQQIAFLRDIIPLFELYDVEDEDDWVEREVGGDEENVRTVRLVRTIYLISKIAEFHTGTLLTFKTRFPKLYQKMEKEGSQNG